MLHPGVGRGEVDLVVVHPPVEVSLRSSIKLPSKILTKLPLGRYRVKVHAANPVGSTAASAGRLTVRP